MYDKIVSFLTSSSSQGDGDGDGDGDEEKFSLSAIDLSIFIVYILGVTMVGIYLNKLGSDTISSFFLGSREIKWYFMAASGMASNLDVSGTMINVAMLYVFGAKGFFVELRGGITLSLAFCLIFQGKWARRSRRFTVADWMSFRFGAGKGGDLARIAVALFSLVDTVVRVTYFCVGSGKFAAEFLGLGDYGGIPQEFWAALMMVSAAMAYTVTSGLNGVVYTDVMQAVFIFALVVYACIEAARTVDLPSRFFVSYPLDETDGDGNDFREKEVKRNEWLDIAPTWKSGYGNDSAYSSLNNFGIAMIFYALRAMAEGMGGIGGYMMQRYFSLSNDAEVVKMTLLWIVLLSTRWAFIMSLALMGAQYGVDDNNTPIEDPERVLPVVVNDVFPQVAKGLALAGFTAAAMSTFDSDVNAGAAYWVKDVYQHFINPAASEKQLMWHSRVSSVVLVTAGLLLSLVLTDVNTAWSFIAFGLFGSQMVPYICRWYWEGCTGEGFTSGILVGFLSSVIIYVSFPSLEEYYSLFIVGLLTLVVVVGVSHFTPQVPNEVLLEFYRTTRPPGIWKMTKKQLPDTEVTDILAENYRDGIGIIFALAFQLSLFQTWMMLVAHSWEQFMYLLIATFLSAAGLYYFWVRDALHRAEVTERVEYERKQASLVNDEDDESLRIQLLRQ